MIIILKQGVSTDEKNNIKNTLKEKGFIVKEIVGKEETVLGAVGTNSIDPRSIEILDGVSSVVPISKPYKLASRELKKEDTIVSVGKVKIGGSRIAVMAGPCAVESEDQIMRIAEKVREAGAVMSMPSARGNSPTGYSSGSLRWRTPTCWCCPPMPMTSISSSGAPCPTMPANWERRSRWSTSPTTGRNPTVPMSCWTACGRWASATIR